MTRRNFYSSIVGTVAGGYGWAYHFEPGWLEVTEKKVNISRGRLSRPLRILHLSDLHASDTIPLRFLAGAFRRAVAERPDLICLTGDYITTDRDFDPDSYAEILKILSSAAPVYAVMGNHDGGSWAAASGWLPKPDLVMGILGRGGVRVLHNRAEVVSTAAGPVRLVGLGDWWSEDCLGREAFAGVRDAAVPTVCLNHNPDGYQECAGERWDLMLCGHTHGGQLQVPLYGPVQVPLLDWRYAVGLNPFDGGRWIHTTRGVGNIEGFRVNCRPELSTVVLI